MKKVIAHNSRPCELHSNLRHIMRLSRWLGAFPVEGLNDHDPSHVRFNLKSFYTAYFIISIVFRCMEFGALFENFFFKQNLYSLEYLTKFAFIVVEIVTVALLYKLARQWPKLIKAASNIEFNLPDVVTSGWTRVKIGTITYAIIALGFVEHLLYVLFKFNIIMNCLGYTEMNMEASEIIMKYHYWYFFHIAPYTPWLVLVAEFACLQGAFLWNISDIMGICFSIYFTSYFQELGRVINSNKPKDWLRIRTRFSRVVVLLNLVNDQLGPFILLSSLTNLFFIGLQFFHSLHFIFNKSFLEHQLCADIHISKFTELEIPSLFLSYHLFSFLFLIIKAMMFSFLAADVHTAANKIVLPLYEVSASEYNQEVKFLQMQLRFTTVGLSGIFFYIERKIILQAIGTLITYELVLLQFNYPKEEAEMVQNSTKTEFLEDISSNLS